MALRVNFDGNSPERLRRAGVQIDLGYPRDFPAQFLVERPCVVQGQLFTDHSFAIGAFSAVYGGHIRCVQIGRYCSISGDVQIGWDDHPLDWVTSSMVGYVADVHGWSSLTGYPQRQVGTHYRSMRGVTKIGHDVWLGHGVFLRAGVTIGDGAVVAARSVVLEDVPPYAIAAGVPAKIVRWRFPPDVAQRLSASRWWDYNLFAFDQRELRNPLMFLATLDRAKVGGLQPYAPGLIGAAELGAIANVRVDPA